MFNWRSVSPEKHWIRFLTRHRLLYTMIWFTFPFWCLHVCVYVVWMVAWISRDVNSFLYISIIFFGCCPYKMNKNFKLKEKKELNLCSYLYHFDSFIISAILRFCSIFLPFYISNVSVYFLSNVKNYFHFFQLLKTIHFFLSIQNH